MMQPHDAYVIWVLGMVCGYLPLHDPHRRSWRRVGKYMTGFVVLLAGYVVMRRL